MQERRERKRESAQTYASASETISFQKKKTYPSATSTFQFVSLSLFIILYIVFVVVDHIRV